MAKKTTQKKLSKAQAEEREREWVTAKHEHIKVKDLTDAHLREILFFLQRTFGKIHGGNAWVMLWGGPHKETSHQWWPILARGADYRSLTWSL